MCRVTLWAIGRYDAAVSTFEKLVVFALMPASVAVLIAMAAIFSR